MHDAHPIWVVDRNDGPLPDEVLVRLFREIMSACLAQQEPLKVGYLGPEGTFSQPAVHKHFGHSAKALPLASVEEEIGRAHVCTPVTTAHIVCRLPPEKKNNTALTSST